MKYALLLLLAVVPLSQAPFLYAAALVDEAPEKWGAGTNGLQIAIHPVQSTCSSTNDPEFEVAFRNVGTKDIVLNLGITLANGRQDFATAVHLILLNPQGFPSEYDLVGPTAVAGRIDDYTIALQVGAVHVLRFKLSQFRPPQGRRFEIQLQQDLGTRLQQGHYRVAARFDGFDARHRNSGMDWAGWSFWIGTLQSNYAEFTVAH
jgi:hypothetical protein